MKFTQLPSGIETIENLVLWGTLILEDAQYPEIEISSQVDPVLPSSSLIARATTGANKGSLFAQLAVNLEIDPVLAAAGPLHLAAKDLNPAGDQVPSYFVFSGSGAGVSAVTPYQIPSENLSVSYRGSDITHSGLEIDSVKDRSGKENHLIARYGSVCSVDIGGRYPGFSNYNESDTYPGLELNYTKETREKTVIIAGAFDNTSGPITLLEDGYGETKITLDSELKWLQGNTSFVSSEFLEAADKGFHAMAISVDSSELCFFLKGEIDSYSLSAPPEYLGWQYVLRNSAPFCSITDLHLYSVKLSNDQITQILADIKAFHSI